MAQHDGENAESLFDTTEAARRLGVTTTWLRDHRHDVPHVRVGRLVRYSQSGLDRYIRQNSVDQGLLVAEERERRRRADSILAPREQSVRQSLRPGPYLTTRDVAEHLRVTQGIVTQWLAVGLLPGYKAGSEWRVAKADLDEWDKLIRWLDDAPTGTRRTILIRTSIEREIADRLGYIRSVGSLRRSGVEVSVWVPRPSPRHGGGSDRA